MSAFLTETMSRPGREARGWTSQDGRKKKQRLHVAPGILCKRLLRSEDEIRADLKKLIYAQLADQLKRWGRV
jgi:hypothetical protein